MLVLGAGVSGMAAARLARSRGHTVTVYSREAGTEPGDQGFAVFTGAWDPTLLQGVDLVVASPGFPERSLPIVEALEEGLPVWSEIELAWRELTAPVVAVTGTNGKTTVTEATSAMLEASGFDAPSTGNIGSALSDHVDGGHDLVVVEVSSFQLRFIETFHPVAAAVTNVAVDHLDWHGSEAAYRAAKARIYSNQNGEDLLVYDVDDPGASELAARAPSQLFPVSGSHLPVGGGGVSEGRLVVGEVDLPLSDLTSTDPIHLVNLATAAALSIRMGATPEAVARAAAGFSPGPHRRSLVARHDGVLWVDDSKATNLHAALASIRAHDSVVLIAGGLAKGIDIQPLADEANVRAVIGIGEAGPGLVAAAGQRGHFAASLEEAVDLARRLAGSGDTVLLAPGCASFDQFSSYAERGDRFARLVRDTIGGGGR